MSAHKSFNRAIVGDYGPSPDLWKGFPYLDVIHDPEVGWVDEDFGYLKLGPIDASGGAVGPSAVGGYRVYANQGGTITPAARLRGGITITSDTDNDTVAFQRFASSFILSPSYGDLFAEFGLLTSTIADSANGFFVGLMEANVVAAGFPVATNGTMADKNLIGFHRLEGDGDKLDFVYKADGQTAQTHLADAATLVAATYTRVGFRFRRENPSTARIEGWQDGVQISSIAVTKAQMAAATFPSDAYLGFCAGITMATGNTGNVTFCWHRIGQLAA